MLSVTTLLRASGGMLLALFGVAGLRWAEAAFVDNTGNMGIELSEAESLKAWEDEMKDEEMKDQVEHMPTKKLTVHGKDVVFAEDALDTPIVGKPIIVKERNPVISAREGVKKTLHQTAADRKDAHVSAKSASKKTVVKKQAHATSEKMHHPTKSTHKANKKSNNQTKGVSEATAAEKTNSDINSAKLGAVRMVATQFAAEQNTADAGELVGGISDQTVAEESSNSTAQEDEMSEDDEGIETTSNDKTEARTKVSSGSANIKQQRFRADDEYADVKKPASVTFDGQSEGLQAVPTDEERLKMDQVPLNREQPNTTVPETHNDTLPLPTQVVAPGASRRRRVKEAKEEREAELDYQTEDETVTEVGNDYHDYLASKRARDYRKAVAKQSESQSRDGYDERFKDTCFGPECSYLKAVHTARNSYVRSKPDEPGYEYENHENNMNRAVASWPVLKRTPVQEEADYSSSTPVVRQQRRLQAGQDYSRERVLSERMGEATYEANSDYDYEDRVRFQASFLMMASYEYSDHGGKPLKVNLPAAQSSRNSVDMEEGEDAAQGAQLLDESRTAAKEVDAHSQDGNVQSLEESDGEKEAPEKGWSGEHTSKKQAPELKTTAQTIAPAAGDRPALAQTGETSVEHTDADGEDTKDEVTDDDAEDEDKKSSGDTDAGEETNDDEMTATTEGDIDVEDDWE
eukprot:TRINITY_DN2793_c0_g1_i1.p1 TRINITY_DN2793_c0_g1~~TRINITY_DN2793_c0_g1_i1.p1  ORF type:complete len:709 (+),score=159.64 TRINITY_DN2793_c0_g1_i1:62-2128(+)